MSRIEVVVSDFGGVLTSPLIDAFVAVQNDTGVSVDQFAKAMSIAGADVAILARRTERRDPAMMNPSPSTRSGPVITSQ